MQELSFLDKFTDGAAEHGLGVTLSFFIAMAFLFVLRKIFEYHKMDRKSYIEIISKQDKIINNHLTENTKAIQEQEKVVVVQAETIKHQGQEFEKAVNRICDSIENQTKIIELLIGKNRNV